MNATSDRRQKVVAKNRGGNFFQKEQKVVAKNREYPERNGQKSGRKFFPKFQKFFVGKNRAGDRTDFTRESPGAVGTRATAAKMQHCAVSHR
jgi:hypothetical protein